MFTTCLVCHTAFSPNETLEHFPLGNRVAYDPDKGRLWAVCRGCKRWTLAPIEDRWEALEELERLVTDRARLLSQTDNISLLRHGPLEIVRVGQANLTEEAWWRYGRQLLDRRRRHKKLTAAATVGVAGAFFLGPAAGMGWVGAWMLWNNAPQGLVHSARWLRFGSAAWRGQAVCGRCGHAFSSLTYRDRDSTVALPPDERGGPRLTRRCPQCRGAGDGAGLELGGSEAERTLKRMLAYHHFAGASEPRIASATRLIETAGSAERVTQIVLGGGKRLGDLRRTGAIALEIAANEASEQRLLEMELADLELHWRQEEELAEIIDGELTPLPLVESMRRRVMGATGG